MIYTLTLNPAIDKAIYLQRLRLDAVNRVSHVRENAGGKGVNISRALRVMGLSSVALAFAGGSEGEKLQALAKKEGVALSCVQTQAPTRENVKIIDIQGGTFTDLNEAGGPIAPQEIEALLQSLSQKVTSGDFVALSGSLPQGVPSNIYGEIAALLQAKGAFVLSDCDGDALACCVPALPRVIKPNHLELAALLKRPLPDLAAVAAGARELVSLGIETVLVTLGGDGALSVSSAGTFHARGLKVPVLSTVGAGDTFLAGYLCALTRGEDPERALRRAMSASTAKVQCEGTDMPAPERMEDVLELLEVETL